MPVGLDAETAKARRRVGRLPKNPGVNLTDEIDEFLPPHSNDDAWRVQILNAFGTQSISAAEAFLSQLSALFWRERTDDGTSRSELLLNAALAIVNGIRPRNEIEACLAAQMVAIHVMTMRLSARALLSFEIDVTSAALAARLARTYAAQADTLRLLRRRRTKQTFQIERHVHHHQHVHVDRGGTETGGQPHGPRRVGADCGSSLEQSESDAAAESTSGAAVPSENQARD